MIKKDAINYYLILYYIMVRKQKKALRGGSVTMPSEYFGKPSGVYSQNPNVGYEQHAYGDAVPVSHGVIHGNSTGPNLHVMPNSSMMQTGGRRHLLKTKVTQFINKMKKTLKKNMVTNHKKKSVRCNKKKSVRSNKKK